MTRAVTVNDVRTAASKVLLNQLEATCVRYGLQTMCEGGGMAENATIIERR